MTNETTGPSPRVRRKRAAKKERILEAAMELLATGGLEKLTIVRLADSLDYTPGALYRYFPSKDALLAEMQRKAISDLRDEIDGAIGAIGDRLEPPAPKVSALLPLVALSSGFLRMLERKPQQVRLINFLLADPRNLITDEQVARTAALFGGALLGVESLFDRALAAGAIGPGSARDRTVMLWTALQGATQLDKMRRFDADRFDPRAIGRGLYRSLLIGWGAAPADIDRAISLLDQETDHASDSH